MITGGIFYEKNKLWTKDFSLITFSTILSVIGGQAMDLPISLLVFDKTKSTFLSAIIMVCGMLPNILFSIAVAPIIDKGSKKKWIVRLDILMAAIYLLTGFYVLSHSFNYALYVVFTLIVGTISVFYHLSYSSWYPDLIPSGMEQKGYAVSGTIYPTISIVMAPFAAFLYKTLPLGYIFIAVSVLTLIAVISEVNIKEGKRNKKYIYLYEHY